LRSCEDLRPSTPEVKSILGLDQTVKRFRVRATVVRAYKQAELLADAYSEFWSAVVDGQRLAKRFRRALAYLHEDHDLILRGQSYPWLQGGPVSNALNILERWRWERQVTPSRSASCPCVRPERWRRWRRVFDCSDGRDGKPLRGAMMSCLRRGRARNTLAPMRPDRYRPGMASTSSPAKATRSRRSPKPDQRRALELVASQRDSSRPGRAPHREAERVVAGARKFEVARTRSTKSVRKVEPQGAGNHSPAWPGFVESAPDRRN
jgi:hypothetical protein